MELSYGREMSDSREKYAENCQEYLCSRRNMIRAGVLGVLTASSIYAVNAAMSNAEEMGEDIGEDAYDCGQPLHNETADSTDNSTNDILECEDETQNLLEEQHVSAEGLLK